MLAVAIGAGAQATSSRPAQTGRTLRKTRVLDDSLQRGEAAVDKKDYASAEAALQECVKADPANYRAWYDLGFVYTVTNRQADAIDAYRKSVTAKSDVFESNLNLGLLLAQNGDPSAEKYLRAATTLKPTSNVNQNMVRAWLALGQFFRKSDPKKALEAYEKVKQLQPNDAEPHLAAAMIAENAKDLATAEREYQSAARLDPKSLEAAAGLANIYMESKRPEEAEGALRKYLALLASNGDQAAAASQVASAHTQLGRVLLDLHRRDEAITEFEEALKLQPGDAKASQQLAWMYLQDKQYDKAEAQFRDLLAKFPKDADLHHGLGSTLLQEKKFPEAQQELLQAVQLKGNLAEAYADLAFAASENKQYALAVRALDARVKLGLPEIPGTLFLRATALDHLGDKVNASNSYRDFLAASNGKYPDQEWQARHRLIAIDPKKK